MSTLKEAERAAIVAALEASNGNMAAAARELGISRSALYAKALRLGIVRRVRTERTAFERTTPPSP